MTRRGRTALDSLDADLRDHLERQVEENLAHGMTRDEARRQAHLRLGNLTLITEDTRAVWVWRWLEDAGRDLAYAWRSLRRTPVFAAGVVISLALGIGASAALFSLVRSLFLRELPVSRPTELVRIERLPAQSGRKFSPDVPVAVVHDLGRIAGVTGAAGFRDLPAPVVGQSPDVRYDVRVTEGTRELLTVLGPRLRLGRLEADAPAAVISAGYWRDARAGSPDAIGARVSINSTEYPIIGVLADEFTGISLDQRTDIWVLQPDATAAGAFTAVARRPVDRAASLGSAIDAVFHDLDPATGGGDRFVTRVDSLRFGLSTARNLYGSVLVALFGLSAVALLATCTNVSTMLGSRHVARRREFAVRAAIGAGRGRLVRQLLTEASLLTIAGAAGAFVMAKWSTALLLARLPTTITPDPLAFQSDRVTLSVVALMSIGSLCASALTAAVRTSRVGPARDIAGAGGTTRRESRRLGRWTVALQVALGVVLVSMSSLFVRSLGRLAAIDIGVAEPGSVFHASFNPVRAGYRSPDAIGSLMSRLDTKIRQLPAVVDVAFTRIPLWSGVSPVDVGVADAAQRANLVETSPGLFATLGMPIVGRDFDASDREPGHRTVVVSASLASHLFPGQTAVGRAIRGAQGSDLEIAGIVSDAHLASLRGADAPSIFIPLGRLPLNRVSDLYVRVVGDAGGFSGPVRRIFSSENPRLLVSAETVEGIVDDGLSRERLAAAVSVFFGVIGVALAMLGVFGTTSLAVATRRAELGVRAALGATPPQLVRALVIEVLAVAGVGFLVGGALGGLAVSVVRSAVADALFGVTTSTGCVLSGVAVLALAVVLGCASPALRAARTDPVCVIRAD